MQKTATFERGSYMCVPPLCLSFGGRRGSRPDADPPPPRSFFDPVLWERVRKEYVLFFDQLETRRADVARGAAGGGGGGGASAAGSL